MWLRLAPHAFRERTLTRGTADAFRDLCEAVAVRDSLLSRIQADGYTSQTPDVVNESGEVVRRGNPMGKHPLLTDYRGMFQRVEAGMLKFRLAPMGKPMTTEPEKPADPFAEFDAKPAVN